MRKSKKTEDEISIRRDIKKYSELDNLAKSKAGQILIKNCIASIYSELENISNNYKTWTLQQFIASGASLDKDMYLMNTLNNAELTRENAEEALETYLKELREQEE